MGDIWYYNHQGGGDCRSIRQGFNAHCKPPVY
jgi:hypothetical protein